MDMFAYASKVRLRSSQNSKYLTAESHGGTSVFQSRHQNHESTVWEVKQFQDDRNGNVIRLRSSYGGYLTGSHHNFLLGWTGKKVMQTNPTKADDLCQWEPVQNSGKYGTLIMLRTSAGTYLRANGGAPPWRNTVTHDLSQSDADDHSNLLWEVEIVQERDYDANLF